MKKSINRLWMILPIILSALFVTLIAVMVWQTNYPLSIRQSFEVIVFGLYGLVIAVFFLHILKTERKNGEEETNLKWNGAYQALADEKKKMDAEIAELKARLAAIPKINPALAGMDNNSLLQKCSFLEQYRNSFPYQICEGYRILAILKTAVEISRYSRWMIVGETGNQLFSLDVIRPDNQSYKEMLQLVGSTKAPQEIQAFSMHDNIWWE